MSCTDNRMASNDEQRAQNIHDAASLSPCQRDVLEVEVELQSPEKSQVSWRLSSRQVLPDKLHDPIVHEKLVVP